MVVVSAPSGAGKSTVCRRLLRRRGDLRYSISCTTRRPRQGEVHGKHYFFLSEEKFKTMIHKNGFLEWAMVHGAYYGTPRQYVERETAGGRSVLLAIDVQGSGAVREKRPGSVHVFLMPPSWSALGTRLRRRGKDSKDSVQRRLAAARKELRYLKEYDYVVVNDDLEKAVEEIDSILTAERLKVSRQNHLLGELQ